jgi:hypothetical protein
MARSLTSSTRQALVGIVVAVQRARDELSRIVGQTMEWSEDLIAEGRVQYESARNRVEPGGREPSAVNAQQKV